jgi:hypothetical protein
MMTKLLLDIRPLKQFALQNLPLDSPLRTILLSELDSVSSEEFLVKLSMWQKLLKFEAEARHR